MTWCEPSSWNGQLELNLHILILITLLLPSLLRTRPSLSLGKKGKKNSLPKLPHERARNPSARKTRSSKTVTQCALTGTNVRPHTHKIAEIKSMSKINVHTFKHVNQHESKTYIDFGFPGWSRSAFCCGAGDRICVCHSYSTTKSQSDDAFHGAKIGGYDCRKACTCIN